MEFRQQGGSKRSRERKPESVGFENETPMDGERWVISWIGLNGREQFAVTGIIGQGTSEGVHEVKMGHREG